MAQATSNIDGKTDEKIQSMLKDVFKECSVLTIAHRIDTITWYVLSLSPPPPPPLSRYDVVIFRTKYNRTGMTRYSFLDMEKCSSMIALLFLLRTKGANLLSCSRSTRRANKKGRAPARVISWSIFAVLLHLLKVTFLSSVDCRCYIYISIYICVCVCVCMLMLFSNILILSS
jgi:hypothetical protein